MVDVVVYGEARSGGWRLMTALTSLPCRTGIAAVGPGHDEG